MSVWCPAVSPAPTNTSAETEGPSTALERGQRQLRGGRGQTELRQVTRSSPGQASRQMLGRGSRERPPGLQSDGSAAGDVIIRNLIHRRSGCGSGDKNRLQGVC